MTKSWQPISSLEVAGVAIRFFSYRIKTVKKRVGIIPEGEPSQTEMIQNKKVVCKVELLHTT